MRLSITENGPVSLYIHFPFCRSRCLYCDFPSGITPNPDMIKSYTDSLCGEILLYPPKEIKTVYLGGGTPSLIDTDLLEKVLTKTRGYFSQDNSTETEITLEANPDDVTIEKVKDWKKLGINRVSLGFQSMDSDTLQFLRRRNTPEQNIAALEMLKNEGFDNISVDWILSVRNDRPDKMKEMIKEFKPAHVSSYNLTIENKTGLSRMIRRGQYTSMTEDEYLYQFWDTAGFLSENGFFHYEISNFATDEKYISRHNMNYWNYGQYIGLGMGASGFLMEESGPVRRTNTMNFSDYKENIDNKILPSVFIEKIDSKTALEEYIMVALRKREGIILDDFYRIFNVPFYSLISQNTLSNLSKYICYNEKQIYLNDRGLDISNRMITALWELI